MEENIEELKRCKEFGRKQLMGKIPLTLQIKEGIQKTHIRLLDESHVMSFLVNFFDPLLLGLNNYEV